LIEIRLQRSGIEISAISIPQIGERFVRAVIGEGYHLVRQEAPVKRGDLRRSVHQRSSGLEGEVTVGAPYAVFVASGTQPHIIVPMRVEALRFEVGGEVVFTKRVQHPGTQPNPFVKRATDRLLRVIPEIFDRIWKRSVK
jgi:hypothetical protein